MTEIQVRILSERLTDAVLVELLESLPWFKKAVDKMDAGDWGERIDRVQDVINEILQLKLVK